MGYGWIEGKRGWGRVGDEWRFGYGLRGGMDEGFGDGVRGGMDEGFGDGVRGGMD